MVHIEMVADGNQDVAGPCANTFRSQLAFQFQVELVHFDVRHSGVSRTLFRNGEHDIEQHGKHAAGHGGHRLGKQVYERDQKQRQCDYSQSERNLFSTNRKVERNLEFALARIGVAQDKYGQAVHGKTPDDAEGVQVGEEGHIAATDKNGDDLQNHDDVDNAVAGTKARMRLAKPVAQHAIFGNTVEHAIRTDDRGIDRASKNHGAHDHYEGVKDQPDQEGSGEIHGQTADKIFQETLPHVVGNDHHGEEGNQRSENHAVNENHQSSLFEVDQFGTFDFAIDLREGFFSAHREHGVPEGDEDGDDPKHVRQRTMRQPTEGARGEMTIAGIRKSRKGRVPQGDVVNAPADENDHHHRYQLHDVQSFFAGFGNAFGVFPPEINGDDDGKTRGNDVNGARRERPAGHVRVRQKFAEQSAQILPRGYAADGPGQNVVKHQRGNAEFGQRSTQ